MYLSKEYIIIAVYIYPSWHTDPVHIAFI